MQQMVYDPKKHLLPSEIVHPPCTRAQGCEFELNSIVNSQSTAYLCLEHFLDPEASVEGRCLARRR